MSGTRAPRAAAAIFGIATLFVLAFASSALAAGPPGGLDGRAWEMVSPVEKGDGSVGAPGTVAAGALQAASGGGRIAYGSTASFGEAAGAAPVNQYLAGRGEAGWGSVNLTPPLLSGTYAGDPYLLFSADLDRAVLTSGWNCRAGETNCAAANPPLAAGAPPGYRNLYVREAGGYRPLITTADAPALALPAEDFELRLAGASPELSAVVISTCAALTAAATEVPSGGGGCVAGETNLYEWSGGVLGLLNEAASHHAFLAAPSGAISGDGARVYFTAGEDSPIYLHEEGAPTRFIANTAGGVGSFQTASTDGSLAFYTVGGKLFRYSALTETSEPLASGVTGVLGAAADGSRVYYATAGGIFAWSAGITSTVTSVAGGAQASDYPPATGTARVSADGTRLAFLSQASLTGYANAGKSEVYLYEAGAGRLICVSCNPKGAAPLGPASLPGALESTEGPPAYKPRSLSTAGTRLFFTSPDPLTGGDTDGRPDVYEWEAAGVGSCATPGGCLGLISGGRSGASAFVDASASGSDVYFSTTTSLLPGDPDGEDIYDAREGGGFPEPIAPIPCDGDACQGPPPAPEGPSPGTASFQGAPNPPLRFTTQGTGGKAKHKKRHHHKKHAKHHPEKQRARSHR